MRNLLPAVIIAFSLTVNAQDNIPSIIPRPATHYPHEYVGLKMPDFGEHTPGINYENNFGKCIKHPLSSPLSPIQFYDSIYHWQWDTLNLTWTLNQKEIKFVYDSYHNLTSSKLQIWNGSIWEDIARFIAAFDDHNNIRSYTTQFWNGSGWENFNRWIYTYDTSDNLISILDQDWDYYSWVSQNQYTNTYDAENNLIAQLYQIYAYGNLQNSTQALYTYDANNHLISGLYQNWVGQAWVDNGLVTYNYSIDNTLISTLYQYFNAGIWTNSGLTINDYDSFQNLISSTYQTWQDSVWRNSEQYIYTYDENNNQTNVTNQRWNGNIWTNYYLGNTTYDADNFAISWSSKSIDENGNTVISGDSTHYYFHTITGTNDLASALDNITVYPNPSSGKFTISCVGSLGPIDIYTLKGNRIFSVGPAIGQTSTEIYLSHYGPGVYVIKLSDGMKIYSRKVVVQ